MGLGKTGWVFFCVLVALSTRVAACRLDSVVFGSAGPIRSEQWAKVFSQFAKVVIEQKAIERDAITAFIANPFSAVHPGTLKGHEFEAFHEELLATASRLEDPETTRALIANELAPTLAALDLRDATHEKERAPGARYGLETGDEFGGTPGSVKSVFSDGTLAIDENGVLDLKTGKQIVFPVKDSWWWGKGWKFVPSGSSDVVMAYATWYPGVYFWNVKTGEVVKASPRVFRPWHVRRFSEAYIPSFADWKVSADGTAAVVAGISATWNHVHKYPMTAMMPADSAVSVFDLTTGERRGLWPRKDPVLKQSIGSSHLNAQPHAFDISADGTLAYFSASSEIFRWNLKDNSISRIFSTPNLGSFAISPSGSSAIVLRSHNGDTNSLSWGHHVQIGSSGPLREVKFETSGIASEDGRWVLRILRGENKLKTRDTITLAETGTGKNVLSIEVPAETRTVGFLPGSRGIVLEMPGKWIKTFRFTTARDRRHIRLDEAGNVAN